LYFIIVFIKFLILAYLTFLCSPAYAYLDPGLGSLILQGLIGAFSVTLGFFVIWKNKIIDLFKKITDKFDKSKSKKN